MAIVIVAADGLLAEGEWTNPYRLSLIRDESDPEGTYRLLTEALMPGERFGQTAERDLDGRPAWTFVATAGDRIGPGARVWIEKDS